MEACIEQGPRLHLLGTWLEQRRRSPGFASFPGAGSFVQICMFLSQTTALCSVTLSLLFPTYSVQLQFLHLPFQAEDKKTALPTGLLTTEKADAHEEDELQAAEEVSGPCGPLGFLHKSGERFHFHLQFSRMASYHWLFFYTPLSPLPLPLMRLTIKRDWVKQPLDSAEKPC